MNNIRGYFFFALYHFPLRFKNHWTETDFVYRICSLFPTILTDSLITDAILWSQCINSCKALLITALYLTVQHSTQNTIVNKKSTAVNLPGILRFWQYLVYAQYCFCPFSTTHEKVSFSYDFFLQPGGVIIRVYSICSAYFM